MHQYILVWCHRSLCVCVRHLLFSIAYRHGRDLVFFQFCGHLHTSYHVMSILHFTLACCCEPEVGVFTVLAPPSTPAPLLLHSHPCSCWSQLVLCSIFIFFLKYRMWYYLPPLVLMSCFFFCLDINSPVFCGFALLRLFLFPFFCPLFSLPCLPFSVSSQSQS